MQFKINPRIFNEYPGASIGVVIAKGANNSEEQQEVMDLLKQQHKEDLNNSCRSIGHTSSYHTMAACIQ